MHNIIIRAHRLRIWRGQKRVFIEDKGDPLDQVEAKKVEVKNAIFIHLGGASFGWVRGTGLSQAPGRADDPVRPF